MPFAAEAGLTLGDGDRFVPENWFMQQDSSGISAETLKAYIAFEDSVYDRMKAVAEGDDTSMAEQMDWASPFASVYGHLMSGLNASDVTDQSVADHLKAGGGKDYPVIGGLGRLVSYLAADIPVELNCTAERIDWGGGRSGWKPTKASSPPQGDHHGVGRHPAERQDQFQPGLA